MANDESSSGADRILDVVVGMLESGGPDAVQVQEVARQARVSLTTIYKHFPSRDDLLAAAVARWMDANVYRHLAETEPAEPLDQALVRHYRKIFEPWQRAPRMAEAFVRAHLSSTSVDLFEQGYKAAEPVVTSLFDGCDPADADDVMMILENVSYALFFKFAAGEIAVTDLLPTMERTARCVTRGLPSARTSKRFGRRRSIQASPSD